MHLQCGQRRRGVPRMSNCVRLCLWFPPWKQICWHLFVDLFYLNAGFQTNISACLSLQVPHMDHLLSLSLSLSSHFTQTYLCQIPQIFHIQCVCAHEGRWGSGPAAVQRGRGLPLHSWRSVKAGGQSQSERAHTENALRWKLATGARSFCLRGDAQTKTRIWIRESRCWGSVGGPSREIRTERHELFLEGRGTILVKKGKGGKKAPCVMIYCEKKPGGLRLKVCWKRRVFVCFHKVHCLFK